MSIQHTCKVYLTSHWAGRVLHVVPCSTASLCPQFLCHIMVKKEPSTGPDIAALPQQHLVKMEADLKGEMDVAGELPAKEPVTGGSSPLVSKTSGVACRRG